MVLLLLLGLLPALGSGSGSTCAPQQPTTDVADPERCAAYPNGLAAATTLACCAACDGAADCKGWVFDPPGKYCYPLAAYSALVPHTADRVFGGAVPPPPPPPGPPPADWAPKVAAHDMLYAPSDTAVNPSHMPMVGNGFLATQVMSASIFVAGIFSGYLTKDPSHRARLPATAAIAAPGLPGPAALDVREATYFRRSFLDPSPAGACTLKSTTSCSNAPARITIEQRWYAHRSRPAVMVHEVQVLPGPGTSAALSGTTPFAMLMLVNSPGGPTSDLALAPASPAPPGATLLCGSTRVAETNTSGLQALCVATTALPSGPLFVDNAAPTATHTLLTIVRTSVETDLGDLPGAAVAEYAAAAGAAADGTLREEHLPYSYIASTTLSTAASGSASSSASTCPTHTATPSISSTPGSTPTQASLSSSPSLSQSVTPSPTLSSTASINVTFTPTVLASLSGSSTTSITISPTAGLQGGWLHAHCLRVWLLYHHRHIESLPLIQRLQQHYPQRHAMLHGGKGQWLCCLHHLPQPQRYNHGVTGPSQHTQRAGRHAILLILPLPPLPAWRPPYPVCC